MSTHRFPRWTHLLVIVLLLFLPFFLVGFLQVVLSQNGQGMGENDWFEYLPLIQLMAFLLPIWYAYRKMGRPRLFAPSRVPLTPMWVALATVGTIFASIAGTGILKFYPKYEALIAQANAASRPTLSAMIAVIFLAPILEELLFRRLILQGYLEKTTPYRAIVYSATLFGLLHFNPLMIVATTVAGIALGYVYYRTRSVLLTIGIHFLNNALSWTGSVLDLSDPAFMSTDQPITLLLSVAVFGMVAWLALRQFGRLLPPPPAVESRPVLTENSSLDALA